MQGITRRQHIFFLSLAGVYVENLSEYFVKSPEEIGKLLKSGKKKLAIAETKMNRQSSRLVKAVITTITIQVNESRGV